MYIFGYLRASTKEQDANRAKNRLKEFVENTGHRVAGWYIENVSGASLQRPELMRLLNDAEKGDIIIIEQVDRLSRLNENDWQTLKQLINEKSLSIVSLDLPTSHIALSCNINDNFTLSMLSAINAMMLDMLAAIARKDFEDRRRRQQDGIAKAKQEKKFTGRKADLVLHEKIRQLRSNGLSIKETAMLASVSTRTVIRISKKDDTLSLLY